MLIFPEAMQVNLNVSFLNTVYYTMSMFSCKNANNYRNKQKIHKTKMQNDK